MLNALYEKNPKNKSPTGNAGNFVIAVLVSMMLFTAIIVSFNVYAVDIESGTFDGVDWRLTSDNELIIGKPNETQEFLYSDTRNKDSWPWAEFTVDSVSFEGTVLGNGSHEGMFYGLEITEFNPENFDTEQITTMALMFENCSELTSIDLTGWNTENLEDMHRMFCGCESLTSADLSSFDTSDVTDMNGMFLSCVALEEVTQNFDTYNVMDMSDMFSQCESLTELDISDWNTENAENLENMFDGCGFTSIALGEDFRFQGNSITDTDKWAYLPSAGTETQKWIKAGEESKTSSELSQSYDLDAATLSGTWVWECTLTYDADGGTVSPSESYIPLGENYVLPTPTRPGYQFDGWYTDEGVQVTDSEPISGDETIYAYWTANTYRITYSGMEGATYGTNHPTEAIFDETFTVDNPTKLGYTFAGWSISDMDTDTTHYWDNESAETNRGVSESEDDVMDTVFKNLKSTENDVMFTATWTPNEYTISYEDVDDVTLGENQPTNAVYDTEFTVDEPEKTGYTFDGWDISGMDSVLHTYGTQTTTESEISKTKADSFKNLRSVSGEVTFTPTWVANTYSIVYEGMEDATFGTNHPSQGTFDSSFTVDNPTKPNYTFDGWYITGMDTNEHTIGSETTSEEEIIGTTETTFENLRASDGTVTFAAQWVANPTAVPSGVDVNTPLFILLFITVMLIFTRKHSPKKGG